MTKYCTCEICSAQPWQSPHKDENRGTEEQSSSLALQAEQLAPLDLVLVHRSALNVEKIGTTELTKIGEGNAAVVCASFMIEERTPQRRTTKALAFLGVLQEDKPQYKYLLPLELAGQMDIYIKNPQSAETIARLSSATSSRSSASASAAPAKPQLPFSPIEVVVKLGCGGYIEFGPASADKVRTAKSAHENVRPAGCNQKVLFHFNA